MIPHTIHYCWFGKGPMPDLALQCIESWHRFMPNYTYKLWNEDNFDVKLHPYTAEAYKAKKYAFVSDYVRLWALKHEGGLYFDVDFEVYKSFDKLLDTNTAFAGYEGSKHSPIMMGVCASVSDGEWVNKMLQAYNGYSFVSDNGELNLTPNVTFLTKIMKSEGLVCDGKEKTFDGLHIYPVEYFCPRLTTGEYVRSEKTYCEHNDLGSWKSSGWTSRLLNVLPIGIKILIIKIKRKIMG